MVMKYKPSITSALFNDGTKVTTGTHKGVSIDFVDDGSTLQIITVESSNEGCGEAQEAIEVLIGDHLGREFTSTIPLHPAMRHIFDKFDIYYSEDDE